MDRPTLEEIFQEEDPVAQRTLRNKRERIIDDLFHPIYSESKVEYEWIVENFLPKGYLAILAGQPKSGKTCLATAIALAVATGTPFAEMPTEQTGVLWLSLEEGRVERRQILDLSPLSDPTTPLYTCYQPLAIDNEDDLCVLFTCAHRNSADLIVIDPLHAATSGRSLTDGWAARKTLQPLKQMCNATGVTALILHHSKEPSRTNRRPRVAESDQLAATASMHMVLTSRSRAPSSFAGDDRAPKMRRGLGVETSERGLQSADSPLLFDGPAKGRGVGGEGKSSKEDPTNCHPERSRGTSETTQSHLLLTLQMQGRGDFANRVLHLVSSDPVTYVPIDEHETPKRKQIFGPTERTILELLQQGPKTCAEIAGALKTSRGSLYNALLRLRSKGFVWRKGSQHGSHLYALLKPPVAKNDA